MPWNSLGYFNLTNDWSFSKSVEGEIFRLIHQPINNSPKDSLRGVIAQGFIDANSEVNKFNPQLFTYGRESEIFPFYFPVGLSEHSIIIKRLDKNPNDWVVEAQVFYAENPAQDYENYLISRFGKEAILSFSQTTTNNMTLTPLLFSGSTTPKSQINRKLSSKKPERILQENEARTEIRIWSSGQPVMLTTGFDDSGEPLELLVKMPPNYYHQDVITTAGMFKGEIWAISEVETYIDIVEYSAK